MAGSLFIQIIYTCIIVISLNGVVVNGQNTCPTGCQCIRETVRCINIQLERIPTEQIPANTKVL